MDKANIRKYLEVIRRAADFIEQELNDGVPVKEIEQKVPEIKSVNTERSNQIDKLLNIKEWPEAIPGYVNIPLTEEDRIDSANAMIQMLIDTSLEKMHFLDFGCGESLVASEVVGVSSSTGYDIKQYDTWKNSSNLRYTTDYNSLNKGGYDVILLSDVLDHCLDVEEVMGQVKELLAPDGIVYIRCHPWTSVHGGHLHKVGLNKSYIHLFINEEELTEKGFHPIFVRHETNPLQSYRWWFRDFTINMERVIRDNEINPFFKNPTYQKLMFEQQGISEKERKDFLESLKIRFVDYVLT